MIINRLTPGFAAEIIGTDVSGALTDADFATIMAAFLAHQVIAIRDQNLSPEEQKSFSRRFGELDIHISSKNKHKDHPELLILSNRKINGEWVGATSAGDEWHTDTQYTPRPSKCTMLHALEVPE